MSKPKNWDQAASDFQRVYLLGLNEYNASLLLFWREQGMIRPGCKVLDIGCGVGRYGAYFAELGCEVTLTDISGEMLCYARENMAHAQTPWTVYQCDFHEATGKETVFAKGFDFVLSTMSSAVSDTETVKKMSALSRGWCFIARFHEWEQPFRDSLMRELGMEPRNKFQDLEGDCASMTQFVQNAGYRPIVRYVNYNWADERTPEEMKDYMLRACFSEEKNQDHLAAELLKLCGAHAGENGTVTDPVNTKVAWVYWKSD